MTAPGPHRPTWRALPLGGDAELLVAPASVDAVVPPPPPPDVARLPGARLVAFELVRAGEATLQVGCARAPSNRWVPGLESLIFERAMGLALAPTGLVPRGLTRAPAPEVPRAFAVERWTGGTGDDRSLEVLSLLAFAGAEADAVACTILCAEPRGATPATCGALVDRTELRGELGRPPEPGPFALGLLWSADHPQLAAALTVVVGLAIVGGVLATRPRRRPTARR